MLDLNDCQVDKIVGVISEGMLAMSPYEWFVLILLWISADIII